MRRLLFTSLTVWAGPTGAARAPLSKSFLLPSAPFRTPPPAAHREQLQKQTKQPTTKHTMNGMGAHGAVPLSPPDARGRAQAILRDGAPALLVPEGGSLGPRVVLRARGQRGGSPPAPLRLAGLVGANVGARGPGAINLNGSRAIPQQVLGPLRLPLAAGAAGAAPPPPPPPPGPTAPLATVDASGVVTAVAAAATTTETGTLLEMAQIAGAAEMLPAKGKKSKSNPGGSTANYMVVMNKFKVWCVEEQISTSFSTAKEFWTAAEQFVRWRRETGTLKKQKKGQSIEGRNTRGELAFRGVGLPTIEKAIKALRKKGNTSKQLGEFSDANDDQGYDYYKDLFEVAVKRQRNLANREAADLKANVSFVGLRFGFSFQILAWKRERNQLTPFLTPSLFSSPLSNRLTLATVGAPATRARSVTPPSASSSRTASTRATTARSARSGSTPTPAAAARRVATSHRAACGDRGARDCRLRCGVKDDSFFLLLVRSRSFLPCCSPLFCLSLFHGLSKPISLSRLLSRLAANQGFGHLLSRLAANQGFGFRRAVGALLVQGVGSEKGVRSLTVEGPPGFDAERAQRSVRFALRRREFLGSYR